MSLDIAPLLEGFDYVPGEIVARRVVGLDNREKVQLRTELGIIQMEADGPPDGVWPQGRESLLHYHLDRLEAARLGQRQRPVFKLSAEECRALRDEATIYYLRYVCCLHLRDYARADGDTSRNLQVMDLCRAYAEDEEDREALEQYRPFVVMMQARARAGLLLEAGDAAGAARAVADAVIEARNLLADADHPDEAALYDDLTSLEELVEGFEAADEEIASRVRMSVELRDAIDREDYRLAARLRDAIRELDGRLQAEGA